MRFILNAQYIHYLNMYVNVFLDNDFCGKNCSGIRQYERLRMNLIESR